MSMGKACYFSELCLLEEGPASVDFDFRTS